MTAVPIEGVRYWYDSTSRAFVAPGRPPLPIDVPPPVLDIFAGALEVGDAEYALPTTINNVKYVDPVNGVDTNPGTLAAPYKTFARAVSQSLVGGYIVLRGGIYHEPFTIAKRVTVQSYPGEAVWFDGSSVYSNWTNNGNGTWTTAYGVTMARFSAGSYPGSDPYRNYTDQVWIDGTALTQIADNTTPGAGQFSVNQTADTLTIGTSPVGKEVRVADIKADGTNNVITAAVTLLGFGVRRYSPQAIEGFCGLAYFGGSATGSLVENVVWQDSAVAGLSVTRADITIRSCTFQDMGHTGLGGTTCDRLLTDRCLFRRLNKGLFDQAPATGGIKLTRADQTITRWCWMEDIPKCNGAWFDVSCTRITMYGMFIDGRDKGRGQAYTCLFIEISDGGFYDGVQHRNWIVGCDTIGGQYPGSCTGSGYTEFWNCRFKEYGVTGLNFGQDRGDNNEDQGNKTIAIVPWRNIFCTSVNNDLGYSASGGGIRLIAYSHWDALGTNQLYLGLQMLTRIEGNWIRPAPPGTGVQLGLRNKDRVSYNSQAALLAADSSVGGPPGSKVGPNYWGTVKADADAAAVPLPANVAVLMGLPEGSKICGPNPANLPKLRAA